jgi:hypothetical protein
MKWKTRLEVKEALSLTADDRRPVAHLVHNPSRSLIAPSIAAKPLQVHRVTTGFANSSSAVTAPTQPIQIFSSIQGSSSDFPAYAPESIPNDTPGYETQIVLASEQRVSTQQQRKAVTHKPRKGRTCRKCAIGDCPGRRRVQDCQNQCRDCGRVECAGRNSHKLHLTCWEAQGAADTQG